LEKKLREKKESFVKKKKLMDNFFFFFFEISEREKIGTSFSNSYNMIFHLIIDLFYFWNCYPLWVLLFGIRMDFLDLLMV